MATKTEIIGAIELLGLTHRCYEPASGGAYTAIEVLKPEIGGDAFPEYITTVYVTEGDTWQKKEGPSCSSSIART